MITSPTLGTFSMNKKEKFFLQNYQSPKKYKIKNLKKLLLLKYLNLLKIKILELYLPLQKLQVLFEETDDIKNYSP